LANLRILEDSFNLQGISKDPYAKKLTDVRRKREIPVPGTPIDYVNIYTSMNLYYIIFIFIMINTNFLIYCFFLECWQDNPDDRPDMQQVFAELKLVNLNINKASLTSENISTVESNILPINHISLQMEQSRGRIKIDNFNAMDVDYVPQYYYPDDENIRGASNGARNFAEFAPHISSFLDIGKDIITLYEKAEHNKELCGSLLERCNFAMAAVRGLDIRKTENAEFFSKRENFELFVGFVKCMKKIKRFIRDVSQLNRLKNFLYANNIEENFNSLSSEFELYMNGLNFSFTLKPRNGFTTMKYDMKQIKDLSNKLNKIILTEW
jgi:hypothetical protein